jgi:hypothetical protein
MLVFGSLMTRILGYIGVTLLCVTLGGTSVLTAVPVMHGPDTGVVKILAVATAAERPDLTAIFNGNYQQYIDQFGTVARAAFDASGKRIGVQVGTYRAGASNGMVVQMTYLEPDADHPLGQAFDGAGNPMPVNTGPRA